MQRRGCLCAVLSERCCSQERRSSVAGHKAAERAAQIAASASPSASKAAAKRKAEASRSARSDWSAEEIRMLEKAVAKFPQGTVKRWDQVLPCLLAEGSWGRAHDS